MTKLTDIMNERMALSFEVSHPKTEKGMENLPGTIEHLCKYQPVTFPVHTAQAAET